MTGQTMGLTPSWSLVGWRLPNSNFLMSHEPSSPSAEQFTAAEWVATPSALGRLSHDRYAKTQGHTQAVHTERICSALLEMSSVADDRKESSERFPDFENLGV